MVEQVERPGRFSRWHLQNKAQSIRTISHHGQCKQQVRGAFCRSSSELNTKFTEEMLKHVSQQPVIDNFSILYCNASKDFQSFSSISSQALDPPTLVLPARVTESNCNCYSSSNQLWLMSFLYKCKAAKTICFQMIFRS